MWGIAVLDLVCDRGCAKGEEGGGENGEEGGCVKGEEPGCGDVQGADKETERAQRIDDDTVELQSEVAAAALCQWVLDTIAHHVGDEEVPGSEPRLPRAGDIQAGNARGAGSRRRVEALFLRQARQCLVYLLQRPVCGGDRGFQGRGWQGAGSEAAGTVGLFAGRERKARQLLARIEVLLSQIGPGRRKSENGWRWRAEDGKGKVVKSVSRLQASVGESLRRLELDADQDVCEVCAFPREGPSKDEGSRLGAGSSPDIKDKVPCDYEVDFYLPALGVMLEVDGVRDRALARVSTCKCSLCMM